MKRMKKTFSIASSILIAATVLATPAAAFEKETPEMWKAYQESKEHKVQLAAEEDWSITYEEEPNDTFEQAQPLEIDSFIIGTLTDSDKDMYKIEVIGDRPVELSTGVFSTLEDGTEMELNGVLYDADGNRIEAEFEDIDEYGFGAFYTVHPGTYYIEASDLANLDNGEEYGVTAYVYVPQAEIERISGADRYKTAAKIAIRKTGGYPAADVVLATGTDYPDALAGAPLASWMDAPILLTKKGKLPQVTEYALETLDTERVTILGGTGAVSKDVENYLKKNLGLEVERVSGTDRFETAAAIAELLPPSDAAIVTYGRNFPDALSAAPVAATYGLPILLTEKNSLPKATEKQLKQYEHSFAVGGRGAISAGVFKKLPDAQRIAGSDRYETSVAVAETFEMDNQFVQIATGADFADALTGSVYTFGEPVLLTPKKQLAPSVKAYFEANETTFFRIFGGTGAVSEKVEDEIRSLFE
ncbi:cell wall-binding repeat-containing protein [Halobacillus sp. ACCC02827]|uniref:cell wall-binding repeat-containing protein n=1 Tax=Halobacillus sp. ACCC02827 TaxID=3052090 RepID=UPI002570DA7F|nr:cell wall-binding repeat-containing protein [Halobacillus sp. ACCC02827]WJE16927.1 cell wall-binding repeat-containing protein [Halobacillus sp. ACCC02827]